MRAFLAGVLSTLLVLALALFVLVLSLPVADRPPNPPRPSEGGAGTPASVAKGETWLGGVDLSSSHVLTSDGPLSDVHATGAGVRLTSRGLRADRLDLEAVIPFATASAQLGDGVELYAAGNGRAGIRRTATLLGHQVAIRATGTVRAESGQLVIEPETVDLGGGPSVLDSVLSAAARRFVTFRHTVTGLPGGLRLTAVAVGQAGFEVRLAGTAVELTS